MAGPQVPIDDADIADALFGFFDAAPAAAPPPADADAEPPTPEVDSPAAEVEPPAAEAAIDTADAPAPPVATATDTPAVEEAPALEVAPTTALPVIEPVPPRPETAPVAAGVPPTYEVDARGGFDDGSRWAVLGVLVLMAVIVGGVLIVGHRGSGDKGARVIASDSTTVGSPTTRSGSSRQTGDSGQASDSSTATTATTPSSDTSTTTGSLTSTTVPLSPPRFSLVTRSVDFGSGATSAPVVGSNGGGQAMLWSASTTLRGLTISPASGQVAGGGQLKFTLVLNRAIAPEGSDTATVAIATDGGNATVSVHAIVNRDPVISHVTADHTVLYDSPRCGPTRAVVSATVTDDSDFHVRVGWRYGVSGDMTFLGMDGHLGVFTTTLGVFHRDATVQYIVVAVDQYGNRAVFGPLSITVHKCG